MLEVLHPVCNCMNLKTNISEFKKKKKNLKFSSEEHSDSTLGFCFYYLWNSNKSII